MKVSDDRDQENREAIKRIHQENPGTARDEEIEILAIDQFGWLY